MMELYEEVKKRNTIAFFGNDAYRRFISLCVINRFAYQIRGKSKDGKGNRRSFILVSQVNQIPLEAQTIRNHTDLRVGEYGDGEHPLDCLTWEKQIADNNVLVMSCSLFNQLLDKSLLSLPMINVIIVNECHLIFNNEIYQKLSSHLKTSDPEITRFLGFAPSLMRCQLKPDKVELIIQRIEKAFQATRNTISDIRMSFRFPVKPKGRIMYYSDEQVPFRLHHTEQLCSLLSDLKDFICDSQQIFKEETQIDGNTLLKAINDNLNVMHTLGPFCTLEHTQILVKELGELIAKKRDPRMAGILAATQSFLQFFYVNLRQQLSILYVIQRLQIHASEKMLCILEILQEYKPPDPESESSDPSKTFSMLNGIIIAEDRSTVRLLSSWLRAAADLFNDFKFLKIDFLIPDLKSKGSKDNFPSSSRLEGLMHKYRKHDINLLVISSCFEEELDVPKCNLVIRFDFPTTFCQYLHCKQKLRSESGKYVFLIPKDEPQRSEHENRLREFASMENIMKEKELEAPRPPPFDTLSDSYPPYTTGKEVTVDLSNALNILYRYCTRLPSDTFTRLVPMPTYQKLDDGKTQCTIHLPSNSPVREPIIGSPAAHPEVALRSAAILTCKALHQAGELNDLLFPVGKENNKCLEELGIKRPKRGPRGDNPLQERPGTTKRRQSYQKQVAEALRGADIVPDEPCNMYIFLMSLVCPIPEEQNTRGRKLIDPMESPRFFGLLTRSRISRICDFPVYTRSGEVLISMKWAAESVKFNPLQVEKMKRFHQFTFTDVLHLVKGPMIYEPSKAPSSYLVLPVNYSPDSPSASLTSSFKIASDCVSIDWEFIDKVALYEQTDPSLAKETFQFKKTTFEDAVVKPWYRSASEQLHFYVANICDNLTPSSPFPTESYPTFYDYYLSKYKIQITDKDQPLLDVDHTSARLNFLTPRFVNRKGMPLPKSTEKTRNAKRDNLQSKQLLVPELCIVHPFSASYWNKAVCLPSILYRVNHLLIADQLRQKVALDIGIGIVKEDPEFSWPKLDFGWSLIEVLNQSIDYKEDDDDDYVPPTNHQPSNASDRKIVEKSTIKASQLTKSSATTVSLPIVPSSVISQPAIEPTSDYCDGLLIDTFDPNIYKVEPIDDQDDDLGPIPPVGNWDLNGMSKPFEINPNSMDPLVNWSHHDGDPEIIELDENDKPIVRGSNGFRTGSPSSFNTEKSKNWMAQGISPSTVIDLDIPGLNLISYTSAGVDLQKLSKDLENIHAYDDFIDSEDEDDFGDIGDYDEELDDHLDEDQLFVPDSDGAIEEVKEDMTKKILSSGLLMSSLYECTQARTSSSIYDSIDLSLDETDSSSPSTVLLDKKLLEELFITDELLTPYKDEIYRSESDDVEKVIKVLENVVSDPISTEPNSDSIEAPICGDEIPIAKETETETEEGEISPSFGELLPNRDEISEANKDLIESGVNCIPLDPLNEQFDPEIGPSPAMVLQALTMSNASDGINLERLETVGDSFLKYAVTVFMYCRCPDQHEGILSQLRSTQISNLKLYELGSQKNLGELMVATKFEPSENWLPPGFRILEKRMNEVLTGPSCDGDDDKLSSFNCLLTQSIPDKSIADCVEALIGAYLISCGPRGALLFMKWLGLMVMDEPAEVQDSPGLWRWLNKLQPPLFPKADPQELNHLYLSFGLDRFEREIIKYEFKDKAYLVQAFTHNSFTDNRVTDCYQRLEFLGDAVLDFLITRRLFDDPRQHSPGVLTDLRSALANNTFFASLAVEYEFHEYLMYKTADLHKVISKFVEHHGSDGKLRDPAAYALLLGEGDCEQPEDIEVPKALGDVFESIAGAIFLDSGFSLDTVWRVYYNMMNPEMEYYSKNPPKSPIRELLEMKPQKVSFSKPETVCIHGVQKIRISVEVFNVGKYYGIGRNRRLAKYTAAKRALRDLKSPHKPFN